MTGETSRPIATSSQTVGPFFHVGPGASDAPARMASTDTQGEHITLALRVLDGGGAPVPDAMVEIRQADRAGSYADSPGFSGFGRASTDADGWCRFTTIKPGASAGADGTSQAPHVSVCLFARGLLRHVYTRIYFAGEDGLASDPILQLVPDRRRSTLVAELAGTSAWQHVIRLQGPGETVFFDV
jgi:protocatechuate 3,4-dioxygenase alpha subunit